VTTGGDILVKVGADTAGFNAGMSSVDSRMEGMTRSVGRMGMILGGSLGVLTGLAVKLAGDYQKSLNIFQSVTKATVPQMEAVDAKAKALGADLSLPATSAKDAADAMTELAKGGLSVNQAMAASKGVLQMSAAASISNADAATITARALKSFGLEGKEAGRVADVLANAANASTGEITDFALGLQQSSAVSKMYGLTINENVAALMEMADAGIAGSDAGTSFKQLLSSMIPVTKRQKEAVKELGVNLFDADGKFVGIKGAISQYHDALAPLPQKQRLMAMETLFGSDAIRAANIVLMGGSKAFGEYTARTEVSGSAAALAAAKMKGFNGAIEGFKSQAETAAISVGTKFLPALTQLMGGLSGVVGWLDKHKTAATALFVITASLSTGMIAFSYGTRAASAAIAIYSAVTKSASTATVALGTSMKATGIGALIGLAGMAVGALVSLKLAAGPTKSSFEGLSQAVRNYTTALDDARQSESALKNGALSLRSAQLSLKEAIAERTRVEKDGTSTALQKARADLTVKQAAQGVKDAQDNVVDSAKRLAVSHQKASNELRNTSAEITKLSSGFNFVVAHGGNAQKATDIFSKSLKQMANEAGGSSTAAGRAVLAVLKLTESMHKVPKPNEIKAAGIFANISKEAQKEGAKTKTAIGSVAPGARAAAVSLGGAIKGGVVEGASGLSGSLAARINTEVNSALAQARAEQGAQSPATKWVDKLGKPLGEGVVQGFLLGSSNLPSNVTERVSGAIEKAKSVVESMQGALTTAFGNLADKAMQAFDAKTAQMLAKLKVTVQMGGWSFEYGEGDLTPAEKTLKAESEARDEKQRQDNLTAAIASGDAQAIADAEWAIREAALIKQAETERAAATTTLETARTNLQARRDLEKEHLEKQIAQLEAYLAKHPKAYKKIHKKIMKLYKEEFGPDYKTAGLNLGEAFATGLEESFGDLEKAAKKFAQILEKYLKLKSPAEKGPLSSIGSWWSAMPDVLLSGVDMSKTGAYIAGGVDASLSAAPRMIGGRSSSPAGFAGARTNINLSVNGNIYGRNAQRELLDDMMSAAKQYGYSNPAVGIV
jgi:TP901 family phage tail tape measure protein